MKIFINSSINLEIFSPSAPLGIFIILIGLIFSGMIFYIIYAVSTNKESIEDKKIRTEKNYKRKEKLRNCSLRKITFIALFEYSNLLILKTKYQLDRKTLNLALKSNMVNKNMSNTQS